MAKLVKRAVTQEDLDLNPELVEEGVEVGAIMKLPPLPEADELDAEDDEDESASDSSIKKVTFHIRNPNVPGGQSMRVFEEASHGAKFLDTANEFEASNTLKTPDKTGLSAEECNSFNVNVKHPVLSRTNE